MAYNPDPKVGEARNLANKYKKSKVIIIMIDDRAGTIEYASYGETSAKCAQARKLADAAYDAIMEQLKPA